MIKEREEIEKKYKWDLDKMFTPDEWNILSSNIRSLSDDFAKYQGNILKSDDSLLCALNDYSYIEMKMSSLETFAIMKKDENNNVNESLIRYDQSIKLRAYVNTNLSFLKKEILDGGWSLIEEYINKNIELQKYKFLLFKMFREEKHTLSKDEEKLLSTLSEVLSSPEDTFNMLAYADLKFDDVIDSNGNKISLTYGTYGTLISSKDRDIRKQTYKNLYSAIRNNKNTIASTLSNSIKTDVIISRIKKFDTALERSLFNNDIPISVYENLLKVVNNNLHLLHRYIALRKKMLSLDKLYFYDLYVPIIDFEEKSIKYDDAVETIKKSLKPLGKEYCDYADEGFNSGWIDVYPNKGKSGGAYSFGSYESMPYILLNYNGSMQDMFTVTHEMGHSMHSLYARKMQPFVYSGYSTFTAEVASTVNEELLVHYLIKNTNNNKEKLFLINTNLECFRLNIFRQSMFAEFELLIHKVVESGESLTLEFLCNKYLELNKKYFGDLVELDDDISLEWARIPHFYDAYYVYQYATGYSAATAIADKIINDGEVYANKYIEFLKSGGSTYPIEALKIAGMDMSKSEPIELAMKKFEKLLNEMELMI